MTKYCLLILLCILAIKSSGQEISELNNYVLDKDKNAVDKELEKIKEAGELTQEANNYYNEALELQSDYELDEKTLQKEITKAESKALSTQMQADKLYSGAYQSLYEICRRNIEASNTITYGDPESYITAAEEMMNNASLKRKEASGVNNPYEKAALLNDAAGMENAAIENMVLAFKAQSGETISLPQEEELADDYYNDQEQEDSYEQEDYKSSNIDQISENLAIDQAVIQKYDAYIEDESIPEPIMVTRAGAVGVSEVSVEEARTILHQHATGDIYATYGEPVYPETIPADKDSLIAEIPQDYIEPAGETTIPETFYKEDFSEKEVGMHSREVFDISAASQSSGVRFMVQLAASRIPITRTQMRAIYPGNLTVEVIREENWYKYRITGFRLFTNANRIAVHSGVRDAWVIATNDGITISLQEAREMTRVVEADVKRRGRGVIENKIDFYVQVMASKVRLSEDEIKSVCRHSPNCREIIEEGWFKYQIYAGTDYQQAMALRNGIPGKAFVVAYEAGSKQNLYKAIHNK
ncbi:MAG: hypothetical protein JXB24_04130 [Bacteroidales bacterium]|nr:hypothetical protein [Bacteroidales bacterium]